MGIHHVALRVPFLGSRLLLWEPSSNFLRVDVKFISTSYEFIGYLVCGYTNIQREITKSRSEFKTVKDSEYSRVVVCEEFRCSSTTVIQ